MFTPATTPDDQTITTIALKGAYEMEAAMAKLNMQSSAQTDAQPPESPSPGTDSLAGETKEQLHNAIGDAATKPNAHEELLAPSSTISTRPTRESKELEVMIRILMRKMMREAMNNRGLPRGVHRSLRHLVPDRELVPSRK